MRHLLSAVVGLVIGSLSVFAVAGSSRLDGPVLLVLSRRHGLHWGDLAVVALAALGLLTLAALHRTARRRPTSLATRGHGSARQDAVAARRER